MSVDRTQEKIDDLFETFTWSDKESQAPLLEEINKEIEAFLAEKNNSSDSTDGVFDFLSLLSDSVQEKFDDPLSSDNDKKRFVKALSRIFALLLNTKVDTAERTKRIIKIAIETTLTIWQEPRQL